MEGDHILGGDKVHLQADKLFYMIHQYNLALKIIDHVFFFCKYRVCEAECISAQSLNFFFYVTKIVDLITCDMKQQFDDEK